MNCGGENGELDYEDWESVGIFLDGEDESSSAMAEEGSCGGLVDE